MLVLTRKPGERIIINDGKIVIEVIDILYDKVRIGFTAPDDVDIDREEIYKRKQRSKENG